MAGILILALLLSACSASSTPVPRVSTGHPTITPAAGARLLRFSYPQPKGISIAAGFDWFGPAFEKATGGRYRVEIYPGAQAVPVPATLDSLKSGAVEMAYTSVDAFPRQFPISLMLGLPSLGFPGKTVKMYNAGHEAFREFASTTPEIQNEFKDFILLQPMILEPCNLIAKNSEIKSAPDFKGLKVGGSSHRLEMVTANKGVAMVMAPGDSYPALNTGGVDAAFLTFSQVTDQKLYEVANFFSEQEFDYDNGVILMNTTFYNDLGAADQKILIDTWRAAMDISSKALKESIETGMKAVAAAGKKIYTPTAAEASAWETQAEPAIQSWRKEAIAQGATSAILYTMLAKWKTIRVKYLAAGNAP